MMKAIIIRLCPYDGYHVILLPFLTHEIQGIPLVFNVYGVVNGYLVFHYNLRLENNLAYSTTYPSLSYKGFGTEHHILLLKMANHHTLP